MVKKKDIQRAHREELEYLKMKNLEARDELINAIKLNDEHQLMRGRALLDLIHQQVTFSAALHKAEEEGLI